MLNVSNKSWFLKKIHFPIEVIFNPIHKLKGKKTSFQVAVIVEFFL